MFKLTVWDRSYNEVGTIERPYASDLLDMGKRLQKDYGAVYKVEWVEPDKIHPECGRGCFACC